MKQCPKCQADISDTAKFCMECGFNIKKYEEEQAKPKARFCPECGTEIPRGSFCPECGFNVSNELNGQAVLAETDTFGDGWLSELESSSNADVATMQAQKTKEQMEKALSSFEYESHSDGTYTVTALKDKHALNIKVPEGVVAIADRAFEGCEAFNISLPEGLLKIGNAAFKNSADLSSINLPQSLITIGNEAFAECETLDIQIPDSVRKVGKDVIKNTVQDKAQRQRAEAEAKRKKEESYKVELAKWEVGCNPLFGSYYQQEGGKQPIEWIVLKRNGVQALLVSKFALDYQPYHTTAQATWESSSLRKWLNNEFLKEAFVDTERQKIQNASIRTTNGKLFDSGILTNDQIFVLSVEEANLLSVDQLKCKPTEYAASNGAYKDIYNGCTVWCLRSPGDIMQGSCAVVQSGGDIHKQGCKFLDYWDRQPYGFSIRPAMWIKI